MTNISWLLEEIESSPAGPHVGAYFDFDGTLIEGYSAMTFFKERLKARDIGLRELTDTVRESINIERTGADVNELIRVVTQAQAGKAIEDVNKMAASIYSNKLENLIYPDARLLIGAHLNMGHTVVIATSATQPQVTDAAEALGVTDIICTEMEVENGLLTGLLAGPVRWGQEKANAVVEHAELNDIDLAESFTYSNGAEDVPFLEVSGHPRPLNPEEELREVAEVEGWPCTDLEISKRHDPVTLARSGLALATVGFSVAAGFGAALINRDRSVGASLAASMGSDLALSTAGVRLNILGEDNAWVQRPAVFLFNHQSQLDAFVLGAVLRRDFTGVAKKQLEHDPVMGPVGYLADIAFVDRSNTKAAVEQLKPVVEALKNGKSIAIAPEGTRSSTQRLLPFKKGPFHMAMQGEVPVIPIVIRNASSLMPPHTLIVKSGTVDVAVLPPIPTDDWTHDNMNQKIDEVRNQFLETLRHWPKSEAELRERF
ncbi:MAG: HAD-IB family hydrolase [Candidatus Nanopelagicales bacterium]